MASSTSIRLPAPLKIEATAQADRMGVSLNALMAVALRDYLDARKLPQGGMLEAMESIRQSGMLEAMEGIKQSGMLEAMESIKQSGMLEAMESIKRSGVVPGQSISRGELAQAVEGTKLPRVGANQSCPCGSGKPYKRCHGTKV